MMSKVDVVVVGGGLAGLGATKTLCDSGKFNVVLLEADSRLGGRVKTDYLDNIEIPLGAASFHGRVGNSMLAYAESEGFTKSDEFCLEDDRILHTYSGGRTLPSDLVEYVEDKVDEVFEDIQTCFTKGDWSILDVGKTNFKVTLHDVRDLLFHKTNPNTPTVTLCLGAQSCSCSRWCNSIRRNY